MKKNFHLLIIIVLIVAATLPFTACSPQVANGDLETISIPIGNYSSLFNVLTDLHEQKVIKLEYSSSEWGAFVTKLSASTISLQSNGVDTFISIYVNTNDINLIDATALPLVVDNENFYLTGIGVSDIEVKEGVKYLFCTVTWDISAKVNEGFLVFE